MLIKLKSIIFFSILLISCKAFSQNVSKSYFEPYYDSKNHSIGYFHVNYVLNYHHLDNSLFLHPEYELYQKIKRKNNSLIGININYQNYLKDHFKLYFGEKTENSYEKNVHKEIKLNFELINPNGFGLIFGYISLYDYYVDYGNIIFDETEHTSYYHEIYFKNIYEIGFSGFSGYNKKSGRGHKEFMKIKGRIGFNGTANNFNDARLYGGSLNAIKLIHSSRFNKIGLSFNMLEVETFLNVIYYDKTNSELEPIWYCGISAKLGLGLSW